MKWMDICVTGYRAPYYCLYLYHLTVYVLHCDVSIWHIIQLITYFSSTKVSPLVALSTSSIVIGCCSFLCSGRVIRVVLYAILETCVCERNNVRRSLETVLGMPSSSMSTVRSRTLSTIHDQMFIVANYCIGNWHFFCRIWRNSGYLETMYKP